MQGSNKPVVLVVDDEDLLRDMLVKRLSKNGNWQVVAARDYNQALEVAAQHHVALVVTDMSYPDAGGKMQDETGRALIKSLGELYASIKFVAMSGTPNADFKAPNGQEITFILKGAGGLRDHVYNEVARLLGS